MSFISIFDNLVSREDEMADFIVTFFLTKLIFVPGSFFTNFKELESGYLLMYIF